MSLRLYNPTPRSEDVGPVVGFFLACIIVPATYAAAGYCFACRGLANWPPDRAWVFAALCGTPLALGGLMQWWDVWMRPAPKLGANWTPFSPTQYLGYLFLYHAIVLLVAGYLIATVPAGSRFDPEKLSASFRITRMIESNKHLPPNDQFSEVQVEALWARRNEIYRQLGHDEEVIAKSRTGRFVSSSNSFYCGSALLLAVLIATLFVPKRTGFTSGHPIQNH